MIGKANFSHNIIWVLSSLFFVPYLGIAQDTGSGKSLHRNSAYVEVGGSSLWYSLSYDRVFIHHNRSAITGRLGASFVGDFKDNNTVIAPLSLSYLWGKNNNFLELGGGTTYLHSFSEKITGIGVFGIIGFRHQPVYRSGFMYRISFTPFLSEHSTDKGHWNWVGTAWGGISLGYVIK